MMQVRATLDIHPAMRHRPLWSYGAVHDLNKRLPADGHQWPTSHARCSSRKWRDCGPDASPDGQLPPSCFDNTTNDDNYSNKYKNSNNNDNSNNIIIATIIAIITIIIKIMIVVYFLSTPQ
jgi:hypothetical protein